MGALTGGGGDQGRSRRRVRCFFASLMRDVLRESSILPGDLSDRIALFPRLTYIEYACDMPVLHSCLLGQVSVSDDQVSGL